jgi:hypothetical protein
MRLILKKIIGGTIIAIGVGLALYYGLWVMFVGGILGIANAVDSHVITATIIAWNLIKIFLASFVVASFVGGVIFYITFSVGMLLWASGDN